MGKTALGPIYLKPVYVKSIWAGERLKEIRGLVEGQVGISREVCAYAGSENRILSEPWAGMSVRELMDLRHEEMMGEDDSSQLVRVAYIDTREALSIQVHPDEELAEKVQDYEKSESWYILEAEPDAYVVAGISLQDKEAVARAINENRLEEYLMKVPVKKGDFLMIPAGLLHACGKNMLALEAGSFGGITYRLYDYGRGRELHLEKGLEALQPSAVCTVSHNQNESLNHLTELGNHRLFSVAMADIKGTWQYVKDTGKYTVITCVEGSCNVRCDGSVYPLNYTQTLFLPACTGSVSVEGTCRILMMNRPSHKPEKGQGDYDRNHHYRT